MANVDNSCANLNIENLHEERLIESAKVCTLGDILNLQAETQKNVYGYDFFVNAKRVVGSEFKQRTEWLRLQQHCSRSRQWPYHQHR